LGEKDEMSNRTITDEEVMRERWDMLIESMEAKDIDCLFMYSTDRVYSGYLRYVTDTPTSLYPLSGLFSKQGISLIGHGVKGLPLYPPPMEVQKEGQYQYYAGGIRQHDFIKNLVGVPACPTTNYAPNMWVEAVCELVQEYRYKRIGLVGMNIIPVGFVQYFEKNLPAIDLVDATSIVDKLKAVKSPYEINLAKRCVWTIDELMSAAPSVMKVGQSVREVGRKLRSLAQGLDCMDLNIMLGKHPTMPMFNEWIFTDEEVIKENDCIELMIEVSSDVGFWGECARVFSMCEPPKELADTVSLAFDLQSEMADMITPGTDPAYVFEKYNELLVANGYPPEKRFCAHGQGYDVVEMPFIRPENHIPIMQNAFIAIHPSIYDPVRKTGCFVCDNYLITDKGAMLMNKTPREIIKVCNRN
jgi:Xaa-Pro aminopeptidase